MTIGILPHLPTYAGCRVNTDSYSQTLWLQAIGVLYMGCLLKWATWMSADTGVPSSVAASLQIRHHSALSANSDCSLMIVCGIGQSSYFGNVLSFTDFCR